MVAFYVKTEQTFAGPFTGVELREASLAGIVGPETPIGGGPNGPWTKAEDAGLFSEKKLPLPHPPGTHVPAYQVRGMQGGLTGPFKLRELIGFAARGMLPPDAMLKSDMADAWIPLNRIPMLVSCLTGQMVLLGEKATPPARQSIDITRSTAHRHEEPDPESEVLFVGDEGLVIAEDGDEEFVESESGEEPSEKRRRRLRLPSLQVGMPFSVQPRLIIGVVCLLLAVVGIGGAYSHWRNMGMSPDEIVGDWIGGGDFGIPVFGLSFRDDDNCVVFSGQGESWAGDYEWAIRADDSTGFEEIDPFSSDVDKVAEGHQRGPVQSTDGYLRLSGFIEEPPMIGGHRFGDCFLRREEDALHIGYLANVTWTRNAKTMEAGWMKLRPLKPTGSAADIIADLTSMQPEKPPVKGYSVESAPHISVALKSLQESGQEDALDGDVGNGSICFSVLVNAEYLLKTYGIPDEARPVYPFEIPELKLAQSFDGTQVVRYGVLKLFIRPDGTLQYVSIML